ncbi:OmpA family protein [Rhodococcus koreensis]
MTVQLLPVRAAMGSPKASPMLVSHLMFMAYIQLSILPSFLATAPRWAVIGFQEAQLTLDLDASKGLLFREPSGQTARTRTAIEWPMPFRSELPDPQSILALQRSAGNSAVVSLLMPPESREPQSPKPSVQRCPGGCAQGACEEQNPGSAGVMPQPWERLETVQRSLVVQDPTTALPGTPPRTVVEDAKAYLSNICPGTTVAPGGQVAAGSCTPGGRTGCECVCDLVAAKNPEPWKIKIDDTEGPHTEFGDRRVVVHSTRSIFEFGAWGAGKDKGKRVFAGGSRVLGHEMCGHAWLKEKGKHPADSEKEKDGGRPGHDPTVALENKVAQEISGPGTALRGSFADPHHGESFFRVLISNYPKGERTVSKLPAEMRARLNTLVAFLKKNTGIKVDIRGHADRTGNAAVNKQCSKQRADNMRAFLTGQGISRSRFVFNVAVGFDECPAAVPGGNPDCRKVEIFGFSHAAGSESHR